MTYFAFILGTAGSGKTTLTYALYEYLQDREMNTITVNLDPGARVVPYPAEVDVREFIDYEKIMLDYELGPNAALIASTDLIGTHVFELKKEIDDFGADVVLVDTPGQMELFAFRSIGPFLVKSLGSEKNVLVFMVDPFLAQEASGYVSVMLLSLSVQCRFQAPQIHVLGKCDMLEEEVVDRILGWGGQPESLILALEKTRGMLRLTSRELLEAIGNIYTAYTQLIPVSSVTRMGLDVLFGEFSRIWTGGVDYFIE